MRLIINKPDFSGFGKVVLWKFSGYGGEDLEPLTLYHGSGDKFPEIDFSEYDFSYLFKKYKFGNALFLNSLDKESRDILPKDKQSLEVIERTLFPSISENQDTPEFGYFGSTNISGRFLYFFEVPEMYYKIDIYETPESLSPSITIFLGPSEDIYNNPKEFYYDIEKWENLDPENKIPAYEHSKLVDEILGKKIVYVLLSTTNSILDFNLAWKSWKDNENSHRNKWRFNLRNDEFYINPEILEGWEDKKSGTLLANSEVEKIPPILKKKIYKYQCQEYSPNIIYALGEEVIYNDNIYKSLISENGGNIPGSSDYWILIENKKYPNKYYSPYKLYSKGDRVIFGDHEYTSLKDYNYFNNPLISSFWILSSKFNDFIVNTVRIDITPGNSVNPNQPITVRPNDSVRFELSEGLGYKFNNVQGISEYIYNPEDYTVLINSWEGVGDNILFNFIPTPSTLEINVRKGTTLYNYQEASESFGSGVFTITGKSIPESGILDVSPGESLEFRFNHPTFILKGIKKVYRVGREWMENYIESPDIVDFNEAVYTYEIQSETRVIQYFGKRLEVDYGRSYTLNLPNNQIETILVSCFYYDDSGNIRKYNTVEVSEPGNFEVLGENESVLRGELTEDRKTIIFNNVNNNILVDKIR